MAGGAVLGAAPAVRVKATISKALRQKNNENTAKFFAAGICGMIFLFILFHWARFLFTHYGRRRAGISRLVDLPRRITRYSSLTLRRYKILIHKYRRARRIFLLRVPGFTSVGHTLLFVGYVATCLAISFVNIDWSSLVNWSKRLGWLVLSHSHLYHC